MAFTLLRPYGGSLTVLPNIFYLWIISAVILLTGCKTSHTVRGAVAENTTEAVINKQKMELASLLSEEAAVELINNGKMLKVTFDSGFLFVANSNTINEASKRALRQFAANLNNHSDTHIQITGHTDNTGRADYNQTLSERRAKSVFDFLCEQGVSPMRMDYSGKGIHEPIANNHTTEGRELNRRVEIQIETKIPAFAPTITQ